jgi:hypothetical protein
LPKKSKSKNCDDVSLAIETPDEVFSILKSLKPVLKSIDVRTVAVAPRGGEWQNLVTSMFLTEKTVDEVRNQQRLLPELRNNYFAIFLAARPFDSSIFGDIIKGEVRFSTPFGINRVQFRKFDPTKLKVDSTQESIDRSYKWKLRAADTTKQIERVELWNVADDNEIIAKRQGFRDIGKLIESMLQIPYSKNSQKDFELVIPSLASIENAAFVDSKFEVQVRKVSNLKDLQLNLELKREDIPMWRDIRKVTEKKPESPELFERVTEVFEPEKILPYDMMNIELILRDSALTMDRTWKFAPLENAVEPFLKTLEAFCPLAKLEKMLLKPESYGKAPDKIFENAVTWLLSLAGYNPIYLGTRIQRKMENEGFKTEHFDVLRTEGGYEYGPTDIIAYEQNRRLLLIDCDIGPIDEKKIQSLIEIGKYVTSFIETHGHFEVIPVLVTPKKYHDQPKKGVRIVDSTTLEMIIRSLAKGDLERARNEFCYFGY